MRPFDYIRARQLRAGRYFRAVIQMIRVNQWLVHWWWLCMWIERDCTTGRRNAAALFGSSGSWEKAEQNSGSHSMKMMERIICCTRILLLCTTTCAAINNTSCYLTPSLDSSTFQVIHDRQPLIRWLLQKMQPLHFSSFSTSDHSLAPNESTASFFFTIWFSLIRRAPCVNHGIVSVREYISSCFSFFFHSFQTGRPCESKV